MLPVDRQATRDREISLTPDTSEAAELIGSLFGSQIMTMFTHVVDFSKLSAVYTQCVIRLIGDCSDLKWRDRSERLL